MSDKNKNDENIPMDGSGGLTPDDSHDLPMSSPRETELGGGTGSTPSNNPNSGPNPINIPTGSDLSSTQARDLPMAGPLYTNEGKSWGDELAAPGAVLMLSPGQTLADRYEIKQRIGAGGMGAVFSAYDKVRDEDIAIKVLLPKLLENPAAKERFLNEAKIASSLSHPNIVNVFDIQQDGSFTFITMELLKGGNLRDEIVRRQEKQQRFTIDEVRNIAEQLCDALSHAHKQTVHRDVKPENIWLCEDGTIKLMDFGIARLMRTSQFTSTGLSMGTAYYMAPEQLKGAKDIDHRADQYSVGVLLYELLTGEIPQGRFEDPHVIRKSIPLGLSNAVLTALEGVPGKRHADIAALKKSLAAKGGRKSARSSGKPFPKKAVIAALILVVAGLGITYPRWKTPAYRWYKTAMAGEMVAKAASARASAEQALKGYTESLKDLPSALHPSDLSALQTRFDEGIKLSDQYDYAGARDGLTHLKEELDGLTSQSNKTQQAYGEAKSEHAALTTKWTEWQRVIEGMDADDMPAQSSSLEASYNQTMASWERFDLAAFTTNADDVISTIDTVKSKLVGVFRLRYASRRANVEELKRNAEKLKTTIPKDASDAKGKYETLRSRNATSADRADKKLVQEQFDEASKHHAITTRLNELWQALPDRDDWYRQATGTLAEAKVHADGHDYVNAIDALSRAEGVLNRPKEWHARASHAVTAHYEMKLKLESTLSSYDDPAEKELFDWPKEQLATAEKRIGENDWEQVDSLLTALRNGLGQVESAIELRREALIAADEASACQTIDTLRAECRAVADHIEKGDRLVAIGRVPDGASAYKKASILYDTLERRAIENIECLVAACRSKLSGREYELAIGLADQVLAMDANHKEAEALRKDAHIGSLLATARANDNAENGHRKALPALSELLAIDPSHNDALVLREEIQGYYCPRFEVRNNGAAIIDLCNGIEIDLVLIQAGSFQMGSPQSESRRGTDEGPQHRVVITESYYMGTYEVTQGQWRAVMGKDARRYDACGDDCPAEFLTWEECQAFCRKLPRKTGLQVRLPTEAEWEYACRAGTAAPFHYGTTISTSLANYDGNSAYDHGRQGEYREKAIAVGSFPPNAWGLYDMHGNAWEWCSDWYDAGYYSYSPRTDPKGPSSGEYRVRRSGSWDYDPWYCRSASRGRGLPDNLIGNNTGFRIVVSVDSRSVTP